MTNINNAENILTLDFDSMVRFLADKFQVRKCSLMLLRKQGSTIALTVKAAVGIDQSVIKKVSLSPSATIAGNLSGFGEGILVENVEEDPRYSRKNKPGYSTKSFICVPIKSREHFYGYISITDKIAPPHTFNKSDLVELCNLVSFLFKNYQQAAWIKVSS